jgi:hypothetical protein
MKFCASLPISLAIALCSCGATKDPHQTLTVPVPPKRELSQAEALLRVIYLHNTSGYSVRVAPNREQLRQTNGDLLVRLHKIRAAKGNIAFKIEKCGDLGEALSEQKGILERQEGKFRYDVSEVEYDAQPTIVWLMFLKWYEDRSVISFTEVGSNPLTDEHFEITHGDREFHMTLSDPYLLE